MSLCSGQIRHLEGSALSRTESKVAFFFEYGSQSAPHFDRTLLPSITIMVFHRHHWEDKGGTQPLLSLSKKTPNDHQTLHTVMHGVQGRMWAEGQIVSDADTHSRSLGGVLALSSNIMEDKPETDVIQ